MLFWPETTKSAAYHRESHRECFILNNHIAVELSEQFTQCFYKVSKFHKINSESYFNYFHSYGEYWEYEDTDVISDMEWCNRHIPSDEYMLYSKSFSSDYSSKRLYGIHGVTLELHFKYKKDLIGFKMARL